MLSVILALAAGLPDPPKFTDNRVPDAALISGIESKLVMPKGAGSLADYDRAYTRAKLDNKDYVFGQMIEHRLMEQFAKDGLVRSVPPVRRVLMNEFAPVADGGCAILTLIFEIESSDPPMVLCNPQP